MLMRQMFTGLCLFLFLPMASFAAPPASTPPQETFVLDKDYELVNSTAPLDMPNESNKVVVMEFFSYGCPWCAKLQPSVDKWLKTKPNNVDFGRVPVSFEPGWEIYSRTYYVAVALGVADKITPEIFNAIHQEGHDLSSEGAMAKFFVQEGIDPKEFEDAYNYSPTVAMETKQANVLVQGYKVIYLPTFVINGKYTVNSEMAGGDAEKMIRIVDFLIAKETKEMAQKR